MAFKNPNYKIKDMENETPNLTRKKKPTPKKKTTSTRGRKKKSSLDDSNNNTIARNASILTTPRRYSSIPPAIPIPRPSKFSSESSTQNHSTDNLTIGDALELLTGKSKQAISNQTEQKISSEIQNKTTSEIQNKTVETRILSTDKILSIPQNTEISKTIPLPKIESTINQTKSELAPNTNISTTNESITESKTLTNMISNSEITNINPNPEINKEQIETNIKNITNIAKESTNIESKKEFTNIEPINEFTNIESKKEFSNIEPKTEFTNIAKTEFTNIEPKTKFTNIANIEHKTELTNIESKKEFSNVELKNIKPITEFTNIAGEFKNMEPEKEFPPKKEIATSFSKTVDSKTENTNEKESLFTNTEIGTNVINKPNLPENITKTIENLEKENNVVEVIPIKKYTTRITSPMLDRNINKPTSVSNSDEIYNKERKQSPINEGEITPKNKTYTTRISSPREKFNNIPIPKSQSLIFSGNQSENINPKIRPLSPHDATPIIVNGKYIDKNSIPAISENNDLPNSPKINFNSPKINFNSPRINSTELPKINSPQSPKINSPQSPKINPELSKINSELPKINSELPKINSELPKINSELPKINSKQSPKIDLNSANDNLIIENNIDNSQNIIDQDLNVKSEEPQIDFDNNTKKNKTVRLVKRVRRKSTIKSANEKPTRVVSDSAVPEYSSMSAEEQARIRAEFRVKFSLIRRHQPTLIIPDFDDNLPLEIVHIQYERYLRSIHVGNSADNYKYYLVALFLVIELIGVKVLGLNFSGYTKNQLTIMNKYERLLIELGEKSYGGLASNWPVEIRILMLALFNAVIFVLIKTLSSWLGPQMGSLVEGVINGFINGNYQQPTPQQSTPQPTQQQGTMPADPPRGNGFDFNSITSLISGFGSAFMGGNNNNTSGNNEPRQRASRRPLYTD